VNMLRKLVPHDAGVPVAEFFDLVRVYPECLGFPGDGDLEFVVAEGLEGMFYARVKFPG